MASIDDVRRDLAFANRLLSNEGVLDAFGHVSARHPDRPDRFFISVSLAPILVKEADIIECALDGTPVQATDRRLYSEGVIHSEIYRARPDVHAVCHHHAPKIMPFCISGEPLVPVSQLGAVIGSEAPFWDSQDEFGDTNLLLTKAEEGASLARALGPHWIVLMKRHGATVVGRSVKELFFRSVHSAANGEFQMNAKLLGHVDALTAGEIERASVLRPDPIERHWSYAVARLSAADRQLT